MHLACAVHAGVDFICTCDDKFLRRARKAATGLTRVASPLELIQKERSVVVAEGDQIEARDLPAQLAESRAGVGAVDAALAGLPFAEARDRAMGAWEGGFLAAALERHGGNVSATARALDLHRQSLQKRLRALGLTREAPGDGPSASE